MASIRHITQQENTSLRSFLLSGISFPKGIKVSLLSTLLLWSSGVMVLTAGANPMPSAVIAQVPLNANVIYVNPAGGRDSPDAGNSEATPLHTITYALQQASAGKVVQLAPGNYTADTGEVFPLIVPAGVILRGDESSKGQRVAIIGGGNYSSRIEANQNVTILAQKDSVISGVNITNPIIRGTGLWIESTNPTVKNNTFTNNRREGILVTGSATPTIKGNIFIKNSGNGISIGQTSKGEIRNNLFEDTGFGIALSQTASPLITENRILNNVDGIVISYSSAPVLRKNIIESNKRDGIVATTNAQPDLGTTDNPGENRIRNNGRYDISNVTRSNTLLAYGNDFDQRRIVGRLEFVATPIATGFLDIKGHWAEAYIQNLADKGIISGFNDGTFRPSDPVTRAQFAAIISKAFAPPPQRPTVQFVDVSSKLWAYEPILVAYRSGFISGYPGQKFRPDQRISKVQVLVSLASGLKLRSNDTSVLSVYQDSSLIPNYAVTAIAGATQQQLVVNYPTRSQLNPNRDATRADVAAFVYQALVNAGRAEAIPSEYMVKNPLAAQR